MAWSSKVPASVEERHLPAQSHATGVLDLRIAVGTIVRLFLPRVVFEIWVIASLLGGYPGRRVVGKHQFEKVESVFIETCGQGVAVIALPLGEGGLVVGIRGNAWPGLLTRSAEQPTVELG